MRDAGKIGTESMQQLDDLEVPVGRGHHRRSETVLRAAPFGPCTTAAASTPLLHGYYLLAHVHVGAQPVQQLHGTSAPSRDVT